MAGKLRKIVTVFICLCFLFEQAAFCQVATPLDISGRMLSASRAAQSAVSRPAHIRALSYDPGTSDLALMLDKGSGAQPSGSEPSEAFLRACFLIGLALPDSSFWVNLRPDQREKMIDPAVARTDMGRVMLAADLELKRDTAGLTSPGTPTGREYWNRLYRKAEELYGSSNVTVPTLTRPWIVPGEILLREAGGNVYIYKARLQVKLESDYLRDSSAYAFDDARQKELNEYSSRLIRELVLPELNRAVNSAQRYAALRQVYYSLILAQWFKKRFSGLTGRYPAMIGSRDLSGLESRVSWSAGEYFEAYRKSFDDGEYNLKETVAAPAGPMIRTYCSGGLDLAVSIPGPARVRVAAGTVTVFGADERKPFDMGLNPLDGQSAEPHNDGGKREAGPYAYLAELHGGGRRYKEFWVDSDNTLWAFREDPGHETAPYRAAGTRMMYQAKRQLLGQALEAVPAELPDARGTMRRGTLERVPLSGGSVPDWRAIPRHEVRLALYQRTLVTLQNAFDARELSIDSLSPAQISQLLSEMVLDWLFQNYGSMPEDFLVDENGTLTGVGKDTVFKEFSKDGPAVPMLATVISPFYTEVLKSLAAKGRLSIELIEPVLERIDGIPADRWADWFVPFAEEYLKAGPGARSVSLHDVLGLLDDFHQRRNRLRIGFEHYFSEITKKFGREPGTVFVSQLPEMRGLAQRYGLSEPEISAVIRVLKSVRGDERDTALAVLAARIDRMVAARGLPPDARPQEERLRALERVIRAPPLEDKDMGVFIFLSAWMLDRVMQERPGYRKVYIARDGALALVVEQALNALRGSPEDGERSGVYYLSRARMSTAYTHMLEIVMRTQGYFGMREFSVIDFYRKLRGEFRRQYERSGDFRFIADEVRKELLALGYSPQERIVPIDTGFVGTIPLFIKCVLELGLSDEECLDADGRVERIRPAVMQAQSHKPVMAEEFLSFDLRNSAFDGRREYLRNLAVPGLSEGASILGYRIEELERMHPVGFDEDSHRIIDAGPGKEIDFHYRKVLLAVAAICLYENKYDPREFYALNPGLYKTLAPFLDKLNRGKTAEPLSGPGTFDNPVSLIYRPPAAADTGGAAAAGAKDGGSLLPGLTRLADVPAGQAGPGELWAAADNTLWMFTVNREYDTEPYRAAGTRMMYQVKRRLLGQPLEAVPAELPDAQGVMRNGTLERVPLSPGETADWRSMSAGELRSAVSRRMFLNLQRAFDADMLSLQGMSTFQIQGILEEMVLDWLFANYGSRAGDFLIDGKGRVIGAGKNSVFKGFVKGSFDNPSAGHDISPFYTDVLRFLALEGELSMDLIEPFLERIDAVPAEQWASWFMPFAGEYLTSTAAGDFVPLNGSIDFLEMFHQRRYRLRTVFKKYFEQMVTAYGKDPATEFIPQAEKMRSLGGKYGMSEREIRLIVTALTSRHDSERQAALAELTTYVDRLVASLGLPADTRPPETRLRSLEQAIRAPPVDSEQLGLFIFLAKWMRDDLMKERPGYQKVYMARDGALVYAVEQAFNVIDGVPENGAKSSIYYLSRVRMSRAYSTMVYLLAEVKAHFGTRAHTVVDRYRFLRELFRKEYERNGDFRYIVDSVRGELAELGYSQAGRIVPVDTGFAGTMPLFFKCVLEFDLKDEECLDSGGTAERIRPAWMEAADQFYADECLAFRLENNTPDERREYLRNLNVPGLSEGHSALGQRIEAYDQLHPVHFDPLLHLIIDAEPEQEIAFYYRKMLLVVAAVCYAEYKKDPREFRALNPGLSQRAIPLIDRLKKSRVADYLAPSKPESNPSELIYKSPAAGRPGEPAGTFAWKPVRARSAAKAGVDSAVSSVIGALTRAGDSVAAFFTSVIGGVRGAFGLPGQDAARDSRAAQGKDGQPGNPQADGGKAPGGIDFRALAVRTAGVDIPALFHGIPASVARMDAGAEWERLRKMAGRGIMPSCQRIKEYVAACCYNGELAERASGLLGLVAELLRREEAEDRLTEPAMKDILVILEAA